MRFPKVTELDADQRDVFQGAPPEGPVLIMGPPGTGKTVVAFHRAHYLTKLKRKPQVVMFTSVLKRYTSTRRNVAGDVPVKTLHKWAYDWWRAIGGRGFPPKLDDQGFLFDWDAIAKFAAGVAHPADGKKVNWGHLIVDEAQDFPAGMYKALTVLLNLVSLQADAKPHPGLTILADENQRLQEGKNSTIEQIRTAMQLAPDRVYCLKKNYRNSRQIAAFAAQFYVGLKSGIPLLPSREGDERPTVVVSDLLEQGQFWDFCATRIARFAKNRISEEIGVLIPNDKSMVKSFCNRLQKKLAGSGVTVQAYVNSDDTHTADSLTFDEPGHVTVVSFASAKGLEFDRVFVIDPGRIMDRGSSEQGAMMNLYVMSSRAREHLEFIMPKTQRTKSVMSWMDPSLYTLVEA